MYLEIPRAWRELLEKIQTASPSAVIAGGCLRDIDNNRPVKDIDVFIYAKGELSVNLHIARLKLAGFKLKSDLLNEKNVYPQDQNLEVIQIVDVINQKFTHLPVQLIFCNWDTSKIIDRFDYGICQLSFDGNVITVGRNYIDDKQNKVFRLQRDRCDPLSMRGSIHRYARLTAEKYQNWTWWPYERPITFFGIF